MFVNEYVTKFSQLSHYTPHEVDTDEKKWECFLNGRNDGLACALEAQVFENFQGMVNKAPELENHRGVIEHKRKLMNQSGSSSRPRDKTWIPDLPKGSDNYRFGWIRDTPIQLQIQRNEPCNLSTVNPRVTNLVAAQLTSPRRLTLACESKNTSKCTEKQSNHRKQLIQLTSGVPQPKNGILFLTEMH
jgi:hypothetical protein